jgi:hypothetical protein
MTDRAVKEVELAEIIYLALRQLDKNAFLQGNPTHQSYANETSIDGTFDLIRLASIILEKSESLQTI